jgi:hypothetical protein
MRLLFLMSVVRTLSTARFALPGCAPAMLARATLAAPPRPCSRAPDATRRPGPVAVLPGPPRAGTRPVGDPARGGPSPEDGFTIFEALVAAALIALVILGGTVVFSQQKQTLGQVIAPDTLRDDVAALDVDVNALQAYDAGVRAKIQSGGTQLWTPAVPATSDVVTMEAQPASGGVSVVAKTGSQAASIVVPLPEPKPTPQ